MNATRVLLARQPMIRFLGKRTIPKEIDHAPQPHPASPTHELPTSFATYRKKAQQHGPLGAGSAAIAAQYGGYIGMRPGKALGPIEPKEGEYFDRNDLPARFRRTPWTQAEIEAVESGGASMFA